MGFARKGAKALATGAERCRLLSTLFQPGQRQGCGRPSFSSSMRRGRAVLTGPVLSKGGVGGGSGRSRCLQATGRHAGPWAISGALRVEFSAGLRYYLDEAL